MKLKDGFPKFLDYLKELGRQPHTIKEHSRMLYGAIAHSDVYDKPINQLKISDTANIIESGMKHGEHGGQRAVLTFRMYLQWLEDNGIKIPFNIRRIKLPKVHTKEKIILTQEEVQEILRAFPTKSERAGERKIAISIKAVCETLIGTGMRISECLSLKRNQFEEIKQKQETRIIAKGGNERTVYFTNHAIFILEEYLNQRYDKCEMMFVNSYGEPLTFIRFRNYLRHFRNQFPEHIKKNLSSHIFRRSLATWLFTGGMDMKSIQYCFGWASERTPLRYYFKVTAAEAKKKFQDMTQEF